MLNLSYNFFLLPIHKFSVAYDVKVNSKEEKTSMNAKMTTTFADSTTFTGELQKTMKTNQVTSVSPGAISADTSSSLTSFVLSPSSAVAEEIEFSRLEKAKAAAAKAASEVTISVVVGILFVVILLIACFLYARRNHGNKKSNAAASDHSSDLEQPKTVVELTVNPMKRAK